MQASTWSALAGAALGLAAAWGPIAITRRAESKSRRAALAAELLASADRLYRSTSAYRSALEMDKPGAVTLESALYDDILTNLHRAAYELSIRTAPDISATVADLLEVCDHMVWSTVPALESDQDVRKNRGRFTDLKIELQQQLR